MLKGFKEFILRGNVIDLAVAVVIGAAFTAVIGAVNTALITPMVNSFFYIIGVSKDGIGGTLTLPGDQVINLGIIIGAVITFLVTAAVVYFVFVAPMNHLKGRLTKRQEEAAETSAEELLGEIRDLLKEQNAAK
ncbi:MAG: large conductance mechanosensitive channel protein MscL [Candidatus Nanopelagicales bacterium]